MPNETFEAKPKSLINIFKGDDDPIYNVPNYQRRYAWIDDQINALWSDLVTAYRNNKNNAEQDFNYFLGSIIVIPYETNNKLQDVIDGQQRLTTLIILFNTISILIGDGLNSEIDPDENPDVIKYVVLQSCLRNTFKKERLRLSTQEQDNIDFEKYVFNLNKEELENLTKPKEKAIKNNVSARFKNALYIFRNEVTELINTQEIGSFVNYLLNKVKIIKITCNTPSFAIKLFQVLNSRGLDLTHADLIKSFLLSNIDSDDYSSFNSKWIIVEKTAESLDLSLTNFFVLYEYYLLANNPEKDLYTELEKLFKIQISGGMNAKMILSDFETFVEEYKEKIYYKSDIADRYIYSLYYTPFGMHWRAILLTAIHVQYSDYEELKKLLRRYYYLNWIAGKNINTLKQPTFDIIKKVKEKRPISEIEERMNQQLRPQIDNELIKGKQIENIVIEKFKEEVFYENWFRPLLVVLEYETKQRDIKFINMDKRLHVEHILPEKYSSNKENEWSYINTDVANKYLFTAGNLTLLDSSQNPEASNWGFEKKINIYKGIGKNNDKESGSTSFTITMKIIEDYDNGRFNKNENGNQIWDESAINKRFNWLCSKLELALEIDTKNIQYSMNYSI